jgi:hypothetical protein
MNQTTERAFETYVEEILLTRSGWKSGSNAEWDKERALLPAQVVACIDRIVTRYMDDKEFGNAAFDVLSQAIYDSIPLQEG